MSQSRPPLWQSFPVQVFRIANEELRRGIDEQRARRNGQLVITGLMSAASVTATSQMLVSGVGTDSSRLLNTLVCCWSLLLSLLVWTQPFSTDLNPFRYTRRAQTEGYDEEDLLANLVYVRMISFRDNDIEQSRVVRLAVYWAAILTGLAGVILPLMTLVDQ